jgi:hypothetical protein
VTDEDLEPAHADRGRPAMSDLALIARLPEVKSAVLSDRSGGFLEALRDPDGEAAAAVAGFLATTLFQAGDELGLGALEKVAFTSDARACLVVVKRDTLVGAVVEPATSLPAVESALGPSHQRR